MLTIILLFFASLLLSVINLGVSSQQHERQKLLVVSYDGFRYDYFERNLTPYMNKLKQSGSYADYMKNIFVTKTFPNHHSIATGLYAESHGAIDSSYYDVKLNQSFKYSSELFIYNNVMPIWILNEKLGDHSGVMMWPGSGVTYLNTTPTFEKHFNISVSWKERVDTVISWFLDPKKPINFGLLYIEEPDSHGHVVGINSPLFNEMLRKLDTITKYLHDKLEKSGLKDTVNVIHLSDHGMSTVTYDNIIDITKYINESDYVMAGASPTLHIYPKPGKKEILYKNLKAAAEKTGKFEVYRKEDIPERYHYSKNPRIAPIFIIAKIGYAFQTLYENIKYYEKNFNITVTNKSEFGIHGYDNEVKEMHPMFFASGPAFLPGCKFQSFNSIDLFPLFCEILELQCPPNNGTLSNLKDCLTLNEKSFKYYHIILLCIGIAMIVLFLGAIVFNYKKKQKARSSYRKILNIHETENCWDEKYDTEY